MLGAFKIDLSKPTFSQGENSSVNKNHSVGVNKVIFEKYEPHKFTTESSVTELAEFLFTI